MIPLIKSNITALLCLLFSSSAFCQEQSIFRQYYLNPFIVNPAFTGAEQYPGALLSVKKQWVGIPDAPSTYLLSGNYRIGNYDFYDPKGFVNKGPLKFKNRIGLGGAVYQDTYGPSRVIGGNLSYGYHAPINAGSEISFGISVTATQYSFKTSLLKPDQPDDPYLMTGNDNLFKLNFNIGALYHSKDNFVGISVAKLLPDVKDVNDRIEMQPSYFLFAGHKFHVNNNIMIEPSAAILKTGDDPVSADLFTKIYIKRLNWIALSYGTTGKMNFLAGIHLIQMLHIGYSYEFTISKISNYNYGTHNLFLGINLGMFGVDEIRQTILRKI